MAKTSKKNRSVLFKILFIFFLIFFLVSAGMVIKNHREAQQSALQFHKLAELPAVAPPEVTLTASQRYAPLKELNSDFFGWLKIEGTNIDYPVCCSPEDPEFYLRRGFDKKYSYYGVPFTEEDAKPDSMNITVYGHNMANGTMFSALEKYKSYQFYEQHSRIRFDTAEGFGEYRIFAVFPTVSGSEDEFKYYQFIDGSQEDYDAYVAKCKELSLYEVKVTPQYGTRLLTLSTCEYSQKNGRFVVVAYRLDQ